MVIEYKQYPPQLAAVVRKTIRERSEIQLGLDELARQIPEERAVGPAFCIFNFITSLTEGEDVTLGIPLAAPVQDPRFEILQLPEMEVLSVLHRGEAETLGESLRALFAYAREHSIISDEFYREIYLPADDSHAPGIELQFVIHNWNTRLAANLERVLGVDARQVAMQGSDDLGIESGGEARFEWVKNMLARLDVLADASQNWDILSGCAHVFPQKQIDKLATAFNETRLRGGDVLQAVDAVLAFMDADPGWAEGGRRRGYTIYVAKQPRDPKAYASAKTDLERRQAYCFCPLVRTRLDQGMPVDFCHCGSGWFRQQWEGAIHRPVRVETLKSVLRGDERCEFAIHLPEDWGIES